MGKRSKEREEIEFLAWKVRKLEKKQKRKHKHRDRDRSPPTPTPPPPQKENLDTSNTILEADKLEVPQEHEIAMEELPTTNTNDISAQEAPFVDAEATQKNTNEISAQEPPEVETDVAEKETDYTLTQELPSVEVEETEHKELLALLGENPCIEKKYGKDIQSDLAVRLEHVATSGLTKEMRKELCDRYLPPGNCTLIDAPLLNLEIKAAVSETVLKRDKGIEIKQKQMGCALAGLGEALTLLLAKTDRDNSVIKILLDTSRFLCDCQFGDSTTRRNFVLFNLKKEMKEQLQKTKIDKLLFGTELQETLKTAKSISKTSADLKQAQPKPPQPIRMTKPPAAAVPTQPTQRNLNWKAPPPNRRPKGIQRPKEPAPKTQRGNYSRPSYRPPQTSRNRY